MRMSFLPWREKTLRTVWKVEKSGRKSLLVGTAHFSPYSFRKQLEQLVRNAEAVLFEGPLDRESMASVARYGRNGAGTPSVYDALEPAVVRAINRHFRGQSQASTTAGAYLELLAPKSAGFLEENARGVRPWMAFFTTWSAFLNYKHSMDVEAYRIALEMGREIGYLETIRDQLDALDGIPFERIVQYLNHFQHWDAHRKRFTRVFIEGKLDDYLSITGEFPTRCESIIGRRDPIFFRGIRASAEQRRTTAFVGVGHVPGILRRFADAGYHISQEAP